MLINSSNYYFCTKLGKVVEVKKEFDTFVSARTLDDPQKMILDKKDLIPYSEYLKRKNKPIDNK